MVTGDPETWQTEKEITALLELSYLFRNYNFSNAVISATNFPLIHTI